MDRRIKFVHEYLLSKIWYVTQIFPPPPDSIRQINTTISWFRWRGEIFRVPLSTLQREKTEGGWNLVNAWAKSRALFMYRLQMQNQRVGSITAGWLRFWNISSGFGNPPHPNFVPATMDYLRTYITDTAYVPVQTSSESPKAYKARIYTTLRALSIAMTPQMDIRIEKLWPHEDWKLIWKNLVETPTSEADIAVWYKVINDIIPTNVRLHRIKMASTDTCKECGEVDTLLHRLTECGEGKTIWDWTQKIIARMLSTSPSNIPRDWLLRPKFCLWPPQRQRAVT
jgi:hypothetical protein